MEEVAGRFGDCPRSREGPSSHLGPSFFSPSRTSGYRSLQCVSSLEALQLHDEHACAYGHAMCNQYNLTTTTEAMLRLRMEWERAVRNVPPLSIYPDYNAPIVRQVDDRRVISLARWGLPSLKDPMTDKVNKGTTNVRHPWFDDWKGYLGVEYRCLVPFDSFAEPTKLADGTSGNAWFALDPSCR